MVISMNWVIGDFSWKISTHQFNKSFSTKTPSNMLRGHSPVLSLINQMKCTENRQHRRALINCIWNLLGFVWLKVHDTLIKMQKRRILFILYHDIILKVLRLITIHLVTCEKPIMCVFDMVCVHVVRVYTRTFVFNSFYINFHVHCTPYLNRWCMALSHIHQGNIVWFAVGRWKKVLHFFSSNLSKYVI